MNQHNNGGAAFPNTGMHHSDKGMSLRDYFAAKAMQGICSANPKATYEDVSAFAYQMADAMLRARDATK